MQLYANLQKAGWVLCLALLLGLGAHAQVIVIDPGHGYTSSGGNPDGRTETEHATALSVGLKLQSQIQSSCSNWTARLTRSTRNGWLTLTQRRTMSNSWRGDRFISIHCNAGGGTGTETFWCNRSNSRDADNSRFSREIQNRMVEKGQWRDRRSVEDGSYIFHLGVLTGNNAIGILSEIGFVDSNDRNKLLNDTWRNRFADAYLTALRNSLGSGGCSGGGGGGGDTQAPTTSISAVGGTTHSTDFTANFNDNDNVGVTRRFYQALELYGSNWYANRNNGFFNDNFGSFYTAYSRGAGTWAINSGRMRQSNTSSTNTALSAYLAQNANLPYLYEFSARLISTTGPRKFGLHIMASDATQSQRGNSYLIWFNGENNSVTLYETVNNTLNTRTTGSVPLDNSWANYKITYSPAFGVLEVFHKNRSVLRYTDSTPIKTGSNISLRTNATAVEFDDLKVYKFRATGSQAITVGSASNKDMRRANGKVKSLVRDAAGNWSTPGNLDVRLTFAGAKSGELSLMDMAQDEPIQVYPNPTNGSALTLAYKAASTDPVQVTLMDMAGKLLHTLTDMPQTEGLQEVNLQSMIAGLPAGYYFVQTKQSGQSATTKFVIQ